MMERSEGKYMATETKGMATTPTRRERQRAATYEEIVTVARHLLGGPEALSLRAIATEMGLTAPALYRYVDSYHELLMLVARAIFEDVIAAMTTARDRYGDDDPGAQILASSVAFRRWALAHPEEFGLIFANPATAKPAEASAAQEPIDLAGQGGGAQFGEFFTGIFLRLWQRYKFAVPVDADLDPDLLELLWRPAFVRHAAVRPSGVPGGPLVDLHPLLGPALRHRSPSRSSSTWITG